MYDTLAERNLGSSPISATPPLGGDPRAGETFAALQTQIDRLNDIHASTSIEWPVVAQLASKILREEGKDLACGTWLALGWFHQHGLPGLADGIHVLRGLVENFWDTMSPPTTRLRGRRNQMQWLLDQLSEAFGEQASGQMPALDEALHAQMLEDWNVLDELWQGHDDQAPAFYGLAAVLRRLPVQVPEQSEEVQGAAMQGDQAAGSAPPTSAAANTNAAVASPASKQAPAAMAPIAVPASAAQASEAVEHALAALHPLVDWFVQELPTAPILFRLNRICAWTTLDQLPQSQGRTTRLPAPAGQIIDSFVQIVQTGEPEAVVRFAESRLASFPCWLDLNRASHHALIQLGANEGAAAVAFETSRLNARLPELAQLAFNDERPFADSVTQIWLQSLDATSVATAEAGADDIAVLMREAESKAAEGKLNEALEHLQGAAHQVDGRRDGFRLRLAQCGLIHRFDAKTDMRALMLPLLEAIDAHRLEDWEPELARQALALAAGIELRYGVNDASPAAAILGRLSRVDVRAAWQLSQSTTG
ncbi:type VI secretion system protein TssA [Pusillimonas sp. SM2304]|uniref:type VI secretion system protein TssA n=1 Tax=Pusillimonas sp. SM2304 TaxID=3073241 RepID=UPI0028762C89|nr:type VI secretion system protein TssA [Pusillimonas sp. SM2304]MDS1139744.1 type VI secretion system protein TssA [Pusillimonas sp. SM2304]